MTAGGGAGGTPDGFSEGAAGRGQPQTGSAAQLAARFRASAAAGDSHLQVGLTPCTVAGLGHPAPALEALDRG